MTWDGRLDQRDGLRSRLDIHSARATDADIAGAANALITGITQQYLTVLQADAQADLAKKTLQRNEEFLKLAQARYGVGREHVLCQFAREVM